jgi:hypothetical protein
VGSRSRARARAQVSDALTAGPSRAAEVAEPARAAGAAELTRPPRSVLVGAVIQGVEAAGVLVASVLAGVDAFGGRSYREDSGIALTVIGIATALALGLVAVGLARGRAWSRTPALLTQLFAGIVSIYLLQGHRYAWGGPGMAVALAGFVALLAPPSLRALARGPVVPGADEKPAPATAKAQSARAQSAKVQPSGAASAETPAKAAPVGAKSAPAGVKTRPAQRKTAPAQPKGPSADRKG